MKNRLPAHAIGIPVSSVAYPVENKADRKLGGKADNLVNCIREHAWGLKFLNQEGLRRLSSHNFSVREGEKLLKASQCYLSTTEGPIAGLLFISTDKIAFCSERSFKFSSPTGEFIRIRYKVSIPVEKLLTANESQNVKRPSRKYIEIVTVDNFDFWFMGFFRYRKTLKCLQQAISQAQRLPS
ncbi:GRAM domain-containing protein [Actinidia rufa]|uniref:GRAM domain-containing protein n=1 Tax=Actinidia rufa TaxID=165716 RepID=A0A7J0GY59_9ERIC|nr:GRAM domain-containing protein [Actinidia rufa]